MAPTSSSSKLRANKNKKIYTSLPSSIKPSVSAAELGVPSQPGQPSRKGKKAWRKNIDITDVEQSLEDARAEERLTGGPVRQKTDAELFVIDTVGDVQVAQKLRRASKPLRSLAVLSERSAVPSLTSRPSSHSHTGISKTEKARLRRLRDRLGPNSSGLSAPGTAPTSNLADVWDAVPSVPSVPGGFGEEAIAPPNIKPPRTIEKHRQIYLEAVEGERRVEVPDAGISYNPKAESHQRLLDLAVQEELDKLKREEEEKRLIEARGGVVESRPVPMIGDDYVDGMYVGSGEKNYETEEDEEDKPVKKLSGRKTKAQRNKAARVKEMARLAQLEKVRKRLEKDVGSAKSVAKQVEVKAKAAREAERLARIARHEKERLGLQGGEKVGKHKVKKGDVVVQLGEDLAETLRQVKPEGNLFKDRFMALQKKALVEPRVPQMPKKRRRKVIEYEKHAYKRFT
ncbi:hypothetical protein M231_04335 [Tremella mesenterica]|uniref:Ribosome biogenesis protein NOP53 n=1 Tax=Tremella mesenterica TaxID=5217 RepID=A0A4Q1BL28_TREME|nr:uncharacterized protein TREMEDRAFT_67175 [Tremella mesenterica DSM 1558]EIW73019.1 hypothetical protein TREMEDRAFT_67175 [Tremella mesenterica DSM 1558]RXK38426.1 hypothetical protein M231_04335 [Tremella mesenterica]